MNKEYQSIINQSLQFINNTAVKWPSCLMHVLMEGDKCIVGGILIEKSLIETLKPTLYHTVYLHIADNIK